MTASTKMEFLSSRVLRLRNCEEVFVQVGWRGPEVRVVWWIVIVALMVLAACSPAASPEQGDPAGQLASGRAALARGDAEGAVIELAAAVSIYPEAATDLARAAKATGRLEEAVVALEGALESHPNNPDLLFVTAILEMDLERIGSAERHLRAALEHSRSHLPSALQLARFLVRANRTREALELLLKREEETCHPARIALDGAPERRPAAMLLQYIAHVHLLRGETDDALRRLEEAISLDPGYAEAHYDLGLVLIARGNLRGAAEALEAAMAADPDHLEAAYQGMNVAERLGREEEARRIRARFADLYRLQLVRTHALEEAP